MPVGSFPPNGHGLHEMCGNVWEWTRDWHTAGHVAPASTCCAPTAVRHNPRGGSPAQSVDPALSGAQPRRVIKGGSWLCAPSYRLCYRPAARQPQAIDSTTNHLGFRCVLVPRAS